MIKINSISNSVSFKGIDILRVQPGRNEPAKIIMVIDEDTFERSSLPKESILNDLEGPYGHPTSGRSIIHNPELHGIPETNPIKKLINLLPNKNKKISEEISDITKDDSTAEALLSSISDKAADATDIADSTMDVFLAKAGAVDAAMSTLDLMDTADNISDASDIISTIIDIADSASDFI